MATAAERSHRRVPGQILTAVEGTRPRRGAESWLEALGREHKTPGRLPTPLSASDARVAPSAYGRGQGAGVPGKNGAGMGPDALDVEG